MENAMVGIIVKANIVSSFYIGGMLLVVFLIAKSVMAISRHRAMKRHYRDSVDRLYERVGNLEDRPRKRRR